MYDNVHTDLDSFPTWYYLYQYVWANQCQRGTSFSLECVWARQAIQQAEQSMNVDDDDDKRDGHDKNFDESFRRHKNRYTDSKRKQPNSNSPPKLPLEHSNGLQTVPELPNLLDLLHYCFYLPVLIHGPISTYAHFKSNQSKLFPLTLKRLKNISWRIFRILFWAVMLEVILHFFYPHAINESLGTLQKQSRLTLVSMGKHIYISFYAVSGQQRKILFSYCLFVLFLC